MSTGNNDPTDEEAGRQVIHALNNLRERVLVVVYLGGAPHYRAFTISPNEPVVVGRAPSCDLVIEDRFVSREHVEVSFEGATWRFRDRSASRGTFVNGVRTNGDWRGPTPRCVRLGLDALIVPLDDALPYLTASVRVENGLVFGPLLQRIYANLADWARVGHSVVIRGESGSGKTDAAAHYARACGREIFHVNSSAPTKNISESTLFGAKKGSHSGADGNSEGWFGASDGKVMFLDEIGDLPVEVQPQMLIAVETGRFRPVGDTRERQVDVRFVSATNKDLAAAVRAGTFRADLLARLEKRDVTLPSLRERAVEMPVMIERMIAGEATSRREAVLPASAQLVEACMLAEWPLNARGLDRAIGKAWERASERGAEAVMVEDCPEVVGVVAEDRDAGVVKASVAPPGKMTEAEVIAVVKEAVEREGSVRKAAVVLGMSPSTVGRKSKKGR